jgi:hypothetical protein
LTFKKARQKRKLVQTPGYSSYPHPVRYTNPEIPMEVFIANPRFEDFDVSAGVCGGSSLPGAG